MPKNFANANTALVKEQKPVQTNYIESKET
jgi:hypothetical protein